MAPSLRECDAMIAAAEKGGRLLSPVAQLRFKEAPWKIKRLLELGLAGRLHHVQTNAFYWRGGSYYDLDWRGRWETEGGGCTLNHAVHYIDLMLWWAGQPREVCAFMTNRRHENSEVEDLSTAILRYPDGMLGQVTSSILHHGEKQAILLQADRAAIALPFAVSCCRSLENGFPEPDPDLERTITTAYEGLPSPRYPGHTGQIENVLQAAEGQGPAAHFGSRRARHAGTDHGDLQVGVPEYQGQPAVEPRRRVLHLRGDREDGTALFPEDQERLGVLLQHDHGGERRHQMNRRETMLALLAGERLQTIPLWLMGFSGRGSVRKFVPDQLLYPFYDEYPDEGAYGFGSIGTENLDEQITFNTWIDRCAFPVGRGTNAAFGHGGPGEFSATVVEKGEDFLRVEYETGAHKEIRSNPGFTRTYGMPVTCEADLERLQLPDPADPGRYEGVRQDAAYARSQGEWTVAWINGIFSAVHYFVMDFEGFLLQLALEPAFARRLIDTVGAWTVTAAQMLCRAGVDCIGFCDDLGSNASMLISPDMYRQYVLPWHRKICDVAHGCGVRVHLHTHGNVIPVLKDIASAGVDILNPVDPDDGMPYDGVRDIVGDRIVLCGGMNKHFFDWPEADQRDFLGELLDKGRRRGPFILMDSAGIPENVTRKRFDQFMRLNRSLR